MIDFKEGKKTTSRIIQKKNLQAILRELKKNGAIVEKLNSGYTVTFNNQLILKAMVGHSAYLVRFIDGLLDQV